MKKAVAFLLVLFFIVGTVYAFADEGSKDRTQKSIFQIASDDLSKISTSKSGVRTPFSKVFQNSHDHIVKSGPKVKKLSLRGNDAELGRRRGLK